MNGNGHNHHVAEIEQETVRLKKKAECKYKKDENQTTAWRNRRSRTKKIMVRTRFPMKIEHRPRTLVVTAIVVAR